MLRQITPHTLYLCHTSHLHQHIVSVRFFTSTTLPTWKQSNRMCLFNAGFAVQETPPNSTNTKNVCFHDCFSAIISWRSLDAFLLTYPSSDALSCFAIYLSTHLSISLVHQANQSFVCLPSDHEEKSSGQGPRHSDFCGTLHILHHPPSVYRLSLLEILVYAVRTVNIIRVYCL